MVSHPFVILYICVLFVLQAFWGCSTSEVASQSTAIRKYFQLPHPKSSELLDLTTLFSESMAPADPAYSESCQSDFRKLKGLVSEKMELAQGLREMVILNPEGFHWCFYANMLALEKFLQTSTSDVEKQKQILETYEFLVSVARIYIAEFRDSRYLAVAALRYRILSEKNFFRMLSHSAGGAREIAEFSSPLGLFRGSKEDAPILVKYQLFNPTVAPSVLPFIPPSGVPLAGVPQTATSTLPVATPTDGLPVVVTPTTELESSAPLEAAPPLEPGDRPPDSQDGSNP